VKTLLLGAQGMLGSALAQIFADTELTALALADLDITNQPAVRDKITTLKPELIINAAAYTDVDGAENDFKNALKVNATAVKYIAEAAKEIDATLVHYSTDYIFPGDRQKGYDEDDKPGPPVNRYGQTKLAAEQALQDVNPRFFILRTAWLYGPNGKNFVDTMLELATKRDELSVINDQFGSPTYTGDLAQATKEIVSGSYEPGIYHTVNSGIATWYEFAQKIFELASVKIKVSPIPSTDYPLPADRPKYSVLNNNRGPKFRPWNQALEDYIQHHKRSK